MATPQDPFPTALSTLQEALQTIPGLLTSLQRITRTTANPHSPEAASARDDLATALADADADLADLKDSVAAASADPTRFGLDASEVARRRGAVEGLGREMAQLQRSAAGLGAGGQPLARAGLPSPGAFEDEGPGDGDDNAYEAYEMEQQEVMMREQDEQLEGVFNTVGNLRRQADEMGRELEEQAGMLDEVDEVADRVGSKLSSGVQKIGWVIKKNEETASSCCIGLLIVVLIILLVMLLIL